MEDPSEEYWEIEKLRWIWRKGLCLGKKIMVTGLVISYAPIVLPPLVAISAFGFACSLPAGFAIVNYVCTEKLINCLLPMPSTPPLLEYGTVSFDEKEYGVVDDIQKGYEENVSVEEKEFEEDTRKGVEMRIELVEEGNNKIDDYDEIVEEEGYEEDDGDHIKNKEQPLTSNAIPVIFEGIREAGDEISMMKSERDETLAAVVDGEDENNVELMLEEMVILAPENGKQEKGHTEMFTGISEEEMRRETTELIEEMRDESEGQHKSLENEGKGEIPMKDITRNNENRDLFVIQEEVKPAENVDEVINAPTRDETANNASIQEVLERKPEGEESESLQAEPNAVVQKNMVVHVKTLGDHTVTDFHQGSDSDRKRGPLILSDADAREMADESGFDLFEPDTLESDQITMSIDESSEEEEPYSEDVIDVNVDYHEVLVVYEVSESKGAKTEKDHDTKAVSDKGSVSEEKIWEQIQAMRTIVGYRETPHSSCVEELKALYMFTGVEPPASFKDPANIADINEKLRFLMSIVGVK